MTEITAGALDVEHLRSWIGGTSTTSNALTADLAARYQATFDLPGSLAE